MKRDSRFWFGTVSIETSERLSNLLNAMASSIRCSTQNIMKKEAEIVAQAGQYGAVTIANQHGWSWY